MVDLPKRLEALRNMLWRCPHSPRCLQLLASAWTQAVKSTYYANMYIYTFYTNTDIYTYIIKYQNIYTHTTPHPDPSTKPIHLQNVSVLNCMNIFKHEWKQTAFHRRTEISNDCSYRSLIKPLKPPFSYCGNQEGEHCQLPFDYSIIHVRGR